MRQRGMILVGIDDTDTLDDPGTNQLARHLVRQLAGSFAGRLVTRHQLLVDPRVPCTRKNGCAAIELEPRASRSTDELAGSIRAIMVPWCPNGSDPGLCIAADAIPQAIVDYGRACQRRLVTQSEARALAAAHGIYLEGLGGTQDGVIGALAAVGLHATRDDGRVVFRATSGESEPVDYLEISGVQPLEEVLRHGVDEVRLAANEEPVTSGTVDVGKRLRPNYRRGKVVLYVAPWDGQACQWLAQKVV